VTESVSESWNTMEQMPHPFPYGATGTATDLDAWAVADQAVALPPPPAPDTLIDLVCERRGHISDNDLRRAGFTAQTIQGWLGEHLLVQAATQAATVAGEAARGATHWYHLAEPDLYIDGLILALWEVPAATPVTIGRLTALEYYGLSVAAVDWVDLAVPGDAPLPVTAPRTAIRGEPLPLELRLFQLPRDLWTFGRTTVMPGLPGSVAIPIYRPAVALAQALADPTMDPDSLTDALLRYLGQWGEDAALQTAVRRYDVERRLRTTQALLSA